MTAPLTLDDLAGRLPSPLEAVEDDRLARYGVRLRLKRDDLIHPDVPGNKWRKLRLNLVAAAEAGHDTLLTFGGAYSNHLRATAAAGRLLGFATVGVVRGDELAHRPLNASLARAAADGMRLHFVDRAAYRRKNEPPMMAELVRRFGRFHPLPEGGSNAAAATGCADLGRELRGQADVVTVACGTGRNAGRAGGGTGSGAPASGGLPGAQGRGIPGRRRGTPSVRGLRGPPRAMAAGFAFPFRGIRADRSGTAGIRRGLHRGGTVWHPIRRMWRKCSRGLYTLAAEGAFAPGTVVAAVVTG